MTTPSSPWPLVTIGIPLFRAAAFVDRIVSNVESIDYPNLEFLIADQHQLDDAIELLRHRIGSDPSVRLYESQDELDWVGNYNFLLRHARGRYVRVLQQDDVVVPTAITAAVERLEADPTIVAVDGPIDVIDAAGEVLACDEHRDVGRRPLRPAVIDSWALYAGVRHRGAGLALVRRSVIVDHGLLIPPTSGRTGLSSRAWQTGLSRHGRIATVDGYRNLQCVHAASFTARLTRFGPRAELARLADYRRATARVWTGDDPSRPERVVASAALTGGLVVLVATTAWRRLRRIASGVAT